MSILDARMLEFSDESLCHQAWAGVDWSLISNVLSPWYGIDNKTK